MPAPLTFPAVMGNSQGIARYDIEISPALIDQAIAALDAGETDVCLLVCDDGEPQLLTLAIDATAGLIQERLDEACKSLEEN